jgi:toxin CcdB
MAQFDVYRNPNPATRARIPYLVDVQSKLLDSLATRVVVPLCKPAVLKGRLAERLNPVFQVEGREVCMLNARTGGRPG